MNAEIIVKKKDETLVHFSCDDSGVLQEISEFFTFYAEGYKYSPAYKNKMWDGKIRLANLRNNTLPHGLVQHLVAFAKSREYRISFKDGILDFKKPSLKEMTEYLSDVKISVNGKSVEMRDYQIDGWTHAIREKRSLLISPTGSGKSLIIYMILRWFLDMNESKSNVLIVVPTTSLVEQMKKDFADYSSKDTNFDAETEVHQIYSGKEKFDFSSRIVVTTWQSAIKLPKNWFLNFGMVIGDEAHQFKAKSLNQIMSQLVNAEYRIGTTGTVDDIKVNQLTLIGNFGPIHRVTSTKALMDSDRLAKLKINCLVLKYPDEIRKAVVKCDYQAEIDYIVTHPGRNRFIKNLACSLKGNTLILFNYIEQHGKPLFAELTKATQGTNTKVCFVSGEVKTIDREIIRELADTYDNLIHFTFGNTLIKVKRDANVKLSDGTFKIASEICMSDDICDYWIAENLNK